jgi:hypothetical protein
LRWDGKLDTAACITASLFAYGIVEIKSSIRLRRAAFVKEYIGSFYLNNELYSIFFELVYRYYDVDFDVVNGEFNARYGGGKEPPLKDRPIQFIHGGDRPVGTRYYHPKVFQRSEEECRLDRLLGYFDILGYYLHKGHIDVRDIATCLGYYIAILEERKVLKLYLDIVDKEWHNLPYQRNLGEKPPFRYVRRLLIAVRKFNDSVAAKASKTEERAQQKINKIASDVEKG